MGVRGKFLSLGSGSGGGADIFGDGSNLFTSNFSNSTLNSLESGITFRSYRNNGAGGQVSSIPVFRNDLPSGRSGFGKSLTMSDTTDNPTITIDGINPASVLGVSAWVYVDVHDNDDNTIMTNINLRRQNYSQMWIYAFEADRSSHVKDIFSAVSTDAWHHFVVTKRSDNKMYTYLNNSLLGSISLGTKLPVDPYNGSGNWAGTSNEVRIMHFADADVSNEVWMTGCRFFNRSLTAAEVTTLYNENPTY
jgi:hypothetical protein